LEAHVTTPDFSGLTDALQQTLDAAKRVEEIQKGQNESEPIEATAADGLVLVKAKFPGTIEVRIEPPAMRLGSEVLNEEIAKAANEALTELRESVGAAAAVDLQEVTESLGELQQESAQRMNSFLDGLFQAHARAAERDGS
jgi:DNA-binding protein YbaB